MKIQMKKIKIIPCDENVIAQIPGIINFLSNLFGDTEIKVYATLEDNKLGFVGETDKFSVFIDNEANYTLFNVGEDGKLCSVYKNNYSIFFNENELSYIIDDNKIEYSVAFCPLQEVDKDGYNGNVVFKQYNPDNDTFCTIFYQHMYREKDGDICIFDEHTKQMSELYIDEDYKKSPAYKPGILPKRAKYFLGFTFYEGNREFNIAAVKDYGILRVAKEGATSLYGSYKTVRYVKASALLPNGELYNNWPLSKQYCEDDLKQLIASYGLKTQLPELFIDLYNDEDEDVTRIKQLIMDISQLKEIEKPETTNMYLKLKLF